jgi:hypothetical protein
LGDLREQPHSRQWVKGRWPSGGSSGTMPWQGNLDGFNDFLRGGFGTPDTGFVLIWRGSAVSRERLGYGETIKWLEERVQNCHPPNVPVMQQRLAAARRGEGQTLFDMLLEIIQDHDDIELRLE